MFPGKKDFRRGKTFEEQLIHPAAFCTLLDEKNPNVLFTIEQYDEAWSYAVDLAWDNGKLDLENFFTIHQGKSEWELEWHFIHEKHVTMRSVSDLNLSGYLKLSEQLSTY